MGLSRSGIYLDANVFIGLIEVADRTLRDFLSQTANQRFDVFTSELTLSEVLVKPIERNQPHIVQMYEETVRSGWFLKVLPVDRHILRRSARLRAELRNKLPDSIHLATALEAQCQSIVSSDKRLRLPPGMTRLTPSQFGDIDQR